MMDEIEARVREMIRASDIPAEVAAALQDSLRYSIRIHTALVSDDDLELGATKIGGQPDLQPDGPWPAWQSAPLNFLAQIRLADIAAHDPDGELPHEGMLSYFFDYTNWGKPERESEGSLATVLYVPEGVTLQRMMWPETLRLRERYAPLAVTSFTRELTVPDFEGPIVEKGGYTWDAIYGDNAIPEARETAEHIQAILNRINKYLRGAYGSHGSVHRLLGHADEIQFAIEYDWQGLAQTINMPEPVLPAFSAVQEADWRLLLQVDSDENGMTWGDVGRIYFGLPRQALATRDFSQTIAELQCT